MNTGTVIFVALALALYLVTVFSAGYRRRWWMAAIVFVVLGVPMGLAIGGEGATGFAAVGFMVLLAAVAWVFGRRYAASRSAQPRPKERPDLFDERS